MSQFHGHRGHWIYAKQRNDRKIKDSRLAFRSRRLTAGLLLVALVCWPPDGGAWTAQAMNKQPVVHTESGQPEERVARQSGSLPMPALLEMIRGRGNSFGKRGWQVLGPIVNYTPKSTWLEENRFITGSAFRLQSLGEWKTTSTSGVDPKLENQHYLEQIGARMAWRTVRDQTALTIAVVDTGVDLDHPDLKRNLVDGVNLVDPARPPEDDNGHGTNIAGVLAGEGHNGIGIAGILWTARIMPIKALDKNGFGNEEHLVQGIRYAMRHGARIIVLAVGLDRYSSDLRKLCEEAERQGILLVAASGNDGLEPGREAAVKYPAAFPTVLAVGGAAADGGWEPRSNRGSELDLVAPWNVYTTATGGGYTRAQGTSMAASQAAAAAALLWAVRPGLATYEMRELLRQSARDIGEPGPDERSGYGLLQLDRAVKQLLRS